jgi:hypothetical protein
MPLRSRHAAGTRPNPTSACPRRRTSCGRCSEFIRHGRARSDRNRWSGGSTNTIELAPAGAPPPTPPRSFLTERGEFDPASEGPAREARPLRARITRPPPPKPLGEVELRCRFDPRHAAGTRPNPTSACPRRRTSCGCCSEFIRPLQAPTDRNRWSGGSATGIELAPAGGPSPFVPHGEGRIRSRFGRPCERATPAPGSHYSPPPKTPEGG